MLCNMNSKPSKTNKMLILIKLENNKYGTVKCSVCRIFISCMNTAYEKQKVESLSHLSGNAAPVFFFHYISLSFTFSFVSSN